MFRRVVQLCLILGFALAYQPARAQTAADEISKFFTSKTPQDIEVRVPTPIEEEAISLRNALDEVLNIGVTANLETVLQSASPELRQSYPKMIALGAIFSESIEDGTLNREALRARLLDFDSGSEWYAGMYADTVLSTLHVSQMELLLGSQYAQSALEQIPDEVSGLVTDAQLLLSEQLTMLYGVSANPEQMLETSRNAQRLQQELGQDYNRYESMTNFLLAFNWRRDHEGAKAMATLIENEARPDTVAVGLTEVYLADLYNEIGEHGIALSYATSARSASDPLIQRRSSGEAMIAYAGLGRRTEAIREMRSLGLWQNGAPTERADRSEGALHARALLAASEGKSTEAVALMNRRLDHMIGRMYDRSANDTASLLSHLENNRERQQERETALQREAELQAVQLEQKNRLNRMLWILITGLAVAFNFLLAFLRYREKNNRKVRDLQEDALSAEKMKTEFLGVINHELRTPLNGIIGMSDAMIHHAQDPLMKAQASTVQESGQLLHDLLDSLITMSTIEGNRLSLDSEPVRLSRLLEREVAEWKGAAEQKGLEYTRHIGPELSKAVLADAPHIRKCTKFLLSNAVRFTHSGRIHLHATGKMVDDTHLALTLIVADTGQGISDAVQERLFKPFLQADNTMTRKYGGAGLSLAIARKLARMMDGDLIVNSREGRGSEFILTARLPLASKAILPVPVKPAAVEPSTISDISEPDSQDVLVLDQALPEETEPSNDEPEVLIDLMLDHPMFAPHREESTERLRVIFVDAEGTDEVSLCEGVCKDAYDCTRVDSAERVLKRLKRNEADVVVINLGLDGLDPIDTVWRIRELPGAVGRVPLIGLTQPQTAAMGSDLIMAGMDVFLTLPLTTRAFSQALSRIQSERDAA